MATEPTEAEIQAAMHAFEFADLEFDGMESGKALRLCWHRALEAAARVRANQTGENICPTTQTGRLKA